MKLLSLLLLLAVSAFGQLSDFTVNINPGSGGPTHIVPGYTMYFKTIGANFVGSDDHQVTLSLSGLPSGVTAVLYTSVNSCCGSNRIFRAGTQNVIQLNATGATTPGNYTVGVEYFIATTGLTRSNTFTLTVDAVPIPPGPPVLTSASALSGRALYDSQRLAYGTAYNNAFDADPLSIYGQQGGWYYDGTRAYIQLYQATNDPAWLPGILVYADSYWAYVDANAGALPGYNNFSKGLALYYNMTGILKYKTAVAQLKASRNTQYAPLYDMIPFVSSREISYALNAEIVSESLLGVTPSAFKTTYANIALGHFNQWFVQQSTGFVQPFMVALEAEALIDYYYWTNDPRVLPAVKGACDWLWANAWDVPSQSFVYDDGITPFTAPDLNLLIVPMYGWVYRMTGDATYRTNGDAIFNGGMAFNYFGDGMPGDGKNYTQQYRWSERYTEWRDIPASTLGAISGRTRIGGRTSIK